MRPSILQCTALAATLVLGVGTTRGAEPSTPTAAPAAAASPASASGAPAAPSVPVAARAAAAPATSGTARSAASGATAAAPAAARPSRTAAPERAGRAMDRLDLDATEITGNRELPKVMVVVPWKRSDIGDLVGKPANSLIDEALAPVDREVFRREVEYYGALGPDRRRDATPVTEANAQPDAAGGASRAEK